MPAAAVVAKIRSDSTPAGGVQAVRSAGEGRGAMEAWPTRWASPALLAGIAFLGAAGCGGSPPGTALREVRVAAASDLKFALDEAATDFQAKHPGNTVAVTY